MMKFISKAYTQLHGHIFALIGITVSGTPLYFKMDSSVSLKILLPIFIFIFFTTSILITALHLAASQISLPQIRKGLNTSEPYTDFSFLALLDPYKLFTFNTVLSVFVLSDGVEELIGTGRVLNVQQNERLLIGVKLVDGKENVKESIIQNNLEILNRILIKPMVEV